MSVIESPATKGQTDASVSTDDLYRQFASELRRLFAGPLGLPRRADDLTNDVFVRLMDAGVSIDPCRPPWPLLRIIAKRLAIKEYRSNRQAAPKIAWLRDREPSAYEEFLSREEAQALYDAIADLPERSRIILVGRELAGLSYEQLAEWDGASVHGLRCVSSRARADLRELYLTRARTRGLAALTPVFRLAAKVRQRLSERGGNANSVLAFVPSITNLAVISAMAWASTSPPNLAAFSTVPRNREAHVGLVTPTVTASPDAQDPFAPEGRQDLGQPPGPSVRLTLHQAGSERGVDSHAGGNLGGAGGETNGHDAFVCGAGLVAGVACQVLASVPASPTE